MIAIYLRRRASNFLDRERISIIRRDLFSEKPPIRQDSSSGIITGQQRFFPSLFRSEWGLNEHVEKKKKKKKSSRSQMLRAVACDILKESRDFEHGDSSH